MKRAELCEIPTLNGCVEEEEPAKEPSNKKPERQEKIGSVCCGGSREMQVCPRRSGQVQNAVRVQ